VAPEAIPLARIMGEEVGKAIQAEHEGMGTTFHLENGVESISESSVTLSDGTELEADIVIVGIGVTPRTELAERAGLSVEDGILVSEQLRASPRIWAVGDVARFPTKDDSARIEHWVVARRQGQFAARDICGRAEAYSDVPYFWSAHGDFVLQYVGHATSTDDVRVSGSLDEKDATISFWEDGKVTAVATVGRDVVSLEAEHLLASGDHEGLEKLVGD
jgi:NADPH-dependent 2,4-dienoyl-CoA reductase/sulfur reductase-like enzyme